MESLSREIVILFVSHDATRTGAPILLLNLAKILQVAGRYRIKFLIKQPGYEMAKDFDQFETFYATAGHASIREKIGLSRFSYPVVKASLAGADLVISNTITNGDILPLIRKYFGGPIISYVHELETSIKKYTNDANVNSLLEFTTHFLVPSEAVSQFLSLRYGLDNTTISKLPYLIPSIPNELPPTERPATFTVGGAGTVEWRKGTDLFLQAAIHTFHLDPGAAIRFRWIGATDGTEKDNLLYDIDKSGLTGRLLLEPLTTNMTSFYKDIDLFVLTSREDPYPLVVLEAADAAVPSVCFGDSGGAQEFINTSGGGMAIDYADTFAMAKAILYYYEHPEQVSQQGNLARAALKSTHQDAKYVTGVFDSIIKRFVPVDNL